MYGLHFDGLVPYYRVGVPPVFAALGLAYVSNLFGSITHYASGQAAAYYGAGYLKIVPTFIIGGLFGIGNMVSPSSARPLRPPWKGLRLAEAYSGTKAWRLALCHMRQSSKNGKPAGVMTCRSAM